MVRDWSRPFVSLMSDFGSRDPSAGIMRGVVLSIAPDALIVDISHDVDKFAVTDGALLLWCALPYMPIGSHVGVVDPGVGTDRRGVALETARGDYLVGPDNGLLIPAAARLGGVVRAHLLQNPQYRLPVVSSSFHGRDLFSPAAAHLAMGVPLESLGPAVSPHDLLTLEWPEPVVEQGTLTTSIIYVDTFGNAKFSALAADLQEALGPLGQGESVDLRATPGGRQRTIPAAWADTFGNVAAGATLLYEDSYGRLCLAVNQGSAAQRLKLTARTEWSIRRTPRVVGTGPTMAQLAAPEGSETEGSEPLGGSEPEGSEAASGDDLPTNAGRDGLSETAAP